MFSISISPKLAQNGYLQIALDQSNLQLPLYLRFMAA